MKKEKADKISIILAGLGIILIFLPVFDVLEGMQQGFIFLGLICIMAAVGVRQMEN